MEATHLEIFNRPQAIENSRQRLLLQTDILHGLTYFDKSLTLEIKNQMHF